MSLKATARAKEISLSPTGEKITRTEKLLLMVMSDHHNTHQGFFYASNRLLAQEALLSLRQFQRLASSLEKKGIVKTETGLGRGNLTGYSFPWLTPKKGDVMTPFIEEGTDLSESQKGDRSDTEKVTFPNVKGDIPRHTLSKEVELTSGTQKVEPSAPEGRGPSRGTAEFSKAELHLEMDLVPWMEKSLRESTSELKWEKPKGEALERLQAAEQSRGVVSVREAWLRWIAEEKPPRKVSNFCFAVGGGYQARPKRARVDFPDEKPVTEEDLLAGSSDAELDALCREMGH